jgi:hypothetical protein
MDARQLVTTLTATAPGEFDDARVVGPFADLCYFRSS